MTAVIAIAAIIAGLAVNLGAVLMLIDVLRVYRRIDSECVPIASWDADQESEWDTKQAEALQAVEEFYSHD